MSAEASTGWQGRAVTSEDRWLAQPWHELPTPSWLPHGHDRLLVVAAHPDDETLGAGGLVATALDAGLEVEVLVATAGEASHPRSSTSPRELAQLRRAELGEAMAALGGPRWSCLDLPDGDLATHEAALRHELARRVDAGAARTLLAAPWVGDRHPDHEAAGRAAAEVARAFGATLLHYPVWFWQWGTPAHVPWDRAVVLPLPRPVRHAKQEALSCYRSQVAGLSDAPGDAAVVSDAVRCAAGRETEVYWLDDPDRRVAAEMEAVHDRAEDPWGVDTRWYERRKRALTLASLPAERYRNALELGCSVGALTADLLQRVDHVTAVDVSASSLDAARRRLAEPISQGRVVLERLQVPWQWPEGRYFDLIMVSEIGYFLSADAWAGLVDRCLGSLTLGGVLVACHWRGEPVGWPLDGDRLHATLTSDDRLRVLASHDEDDFWLHVLTPATDGAG